jgi:misacylated tRNA(Ala) deacylase
MKPNEGRLQTAEHILARTLKHRFSDAKFIISKFEENSGYMEIATKEDLRKVNRALLQDDVNEIIKKNLLVSKHILKREDAEREFDLRRLPSSLKEIRIIEIEGFDKTPCKDPHVENTSEIGYLAVLRVKKVGKDRYRFVFEVR